MVASEIIMNTTPPYLSVAAVKNNDNNNIINNYYNGHTTQYECLQANNRWKCLLHCEHGSRGMQRSPPEIVQSITEGVVWVWLVNTAEIFGAAFPSHIKEKICTDQRLSTLGRT